MDENVNYEYDEDYDSQDSNGNFNLLFVTHYAVFFFNIYLFSDENYFANDYPEEMTSSCEDNSSDAEDVAYFSDYDEFDLGF